MENLQFDQGQRYMYLYSECKQSLDKFKYISNKFPNMYPASLMIE